MPGGRSTASTAWNRSCPGRTTRSRRGWRERFARGFPTKQSADWAWIQHLLASTREETGRIGVVIDNGCLFRGGKEKSIRRAMVEDDVIEAILLLPEKLFYNTGAPGAILILRGQKPAERKGRILVIREMRVMLDRDLAELYGVPTKRLNEQVKRNLARFPQDFMFQLTREEFDDLKSHFATSRWGGVRKLPYAFTEQGVAMLSSVLNSHRAIQVNILIMRAFIKMREMALGFAELKRKIDELEEKYDAQFRVVFDAVRQLMSPAEEEGKRGRIGFVKSGD